MNFNAFDWYLLALSIVVAFVSAIVIERGIRAVGLVSKNTCRQMQRSIFNFATVIVAAMVLLCWQVPILLVLAFAIATAVVKGLVCGREKLEKEIKERVTRMRSAAKWAAEHFSDLDINHDLLICEVDLSRFLALDSVPKDDYLKAFLIRDELQTIGHPAVPLSRSTAYLHAPYVVSLKDLQDCYERYQAICLDWHNIT